MEGGREGGSSGDHRKAIARVGLESLVILLNLLYLFI